MAINDYKAELDRSGIVAFVPGGNSMWPTLKNRGQSVIIVAKTGRLNKYDVAFYIRADGSYVLHRVMEVKDYGYITLGDSQVTPEKVKEEQVIGVLSGFYRGKQFIDCKDEKYIKKVEKWFSHKKTRKIRLKLFWLKNAVKNKLGIGRNKNV